MWRADRRHRGHARGVRSRFWPHAEVRDGARRARARRRGHDSPGNRQPHLRTRFVTRPKGGLVTRAREARRHHGVHQRAGHGHRPHAPNEAKMVFSRFLARRRGTHARERRPWGIGLVPWVKGRSSSADNGWGAGEGRKGEGRIASPFHIPLYQGDEQQRGAEIAKIAWEVA